ncbi:hypothetical protein EXN66_Car012395 [Channa argus]|uniref:Uncharacterized protein n=1 Tax=Channa argus TaxID=215402 RepID=A0A6G1Q2J0_CHAAH|nr:hypothetical protein EXN66_Car012395 [Channa argus]
MAESDQVSSSHLKDSQRIENDVPCFLNHLFPIVAFLSSNMPTPSRKKKIQTEKPGLLVYSGRQLLIASVRSE